MGSPVICPPPDACHKQGSCDPSTGTCDNPAKDEGASCDDGNLCTLDDECQSEVCVGSPVICPPPDACHKPGSCNPSTGMCDNPAKDDGASCDSDGDPCTPDDHCKDGVCVAGEPKTCASYACDKATGQCLARCQSARDCVDGKVCDRTHQCVDAPPDAYHHDTSGCALAAPGSPPPSPRTLAALFMLALAALGARRPRAVA
ncbi:hypothetical protein BE20_01460 [Sorangium cellulosum]|nr:hypothetical protein BE20_01460 [Sorangium cellulosum]